MKAVKINMNERSQSKAVKALAVGVLAQFAVVGLITVALSLLITVVGSLFADTANFLMLVPIAIGSYTGGFICARINKTNGLLLGGLTALCLLLVIVAVGIGTDKSITYMLLIKAFICLLSGAFGGVKGVNKKEKLKMH